MPDSLLLDLHEGVQTITLNRPQALNAFTRGLLKELDDALKAAERDDAVRAVVLTGAGRAFSSGQDVSELRDLLDAAGPGGGGLGVLLRDAINPVILRLRALDRPVLAAVNGPAAGAGMGLALACDVRYAAQSARFVLAFVNVGLVPDAGSQYFLPRLVGTSRALELAWSGRPVAADEARELGLVEEVFPDDELLGRAQAFAARLAAGPRTAISLIKRGLRRSHESTLERMLEVEEQYQEIASRHADAAEGVRAFLEKRAPRFGAD